MVRLNYRFLSIFILFIFLISTVSAKELSTSDATFLRKILDSKLATNCVETLEEQLAIYESLQKEIHSQKQNISAETFLICDVMIILDREAAIAADSIKGLDQSELRKLYKENKKSTEVTENQKIVLDCYNRYQKFAEENKDLSSHFYFHQRECSSTAMPYFSTKEQIQLVTTMLDDYKRIEELNPNYSENLTFLGMLMYIIPGAFGGNKKEGLEKLELACSSAKCDYEKINACVMYSQILLEEKQKEKASEYMNRALNLNPQNKAIQKIKQINDMGYSMFQIEKYKDKITLF